MRIGDAARRVGISPTTLKRLEKRGLIRVPRDHSGQRRYTESDIATIRALYYPGTVAAGAVALDAADRPA
jgi:DNA-binding transcriptional MerR regulator